MSGTKTVQSDSTLELQLKRHPASYSSSVMWRLFRVSSWPSTSLTRHLPQEPLPEQGASMATLARRASSSRLSPALHSMVTGVAPSIWKVTFITWKSFRVSIVGRGHDPADQVAVTSAVRFVQTDFMSQKPAAQTNRCVGGVMTPPYIRFWEMGGRRCRPLSKITLKVPGPGRDGSFR